MGSVGPGGAGRGLGGWPVGAGWVGRGGRWGRVGCGEEGGVDWYGPVSRNAILQLERAYVVC